MSTSPEKSVFCFLEDSTPSLKESSLFKMLLDELECPICTCLMVGRRTALLCSNGHPCCSYCSNRVSTCPFCRCEVSWSLCLPLQNIATWLLRKGFVCEASPPPTMSPQSETPAASFIFRRSERILRRIRSDDFSLSVAVTSPTRAASSVPSSVVELRLGTTNPSSLTPTPGGSPP